MTNVITATLRANELGGHQRHLRVCRAVLSAHYNLTLIKPLQEPSLHHVNCHEFNLSCNRTSKPYKSIIHLIAKLIKIRISKNKADIAFSVGIWEYIIISLCLIGTNTKHIFLLRSNILKRKKYKIYSTSLSKTKKTLHYFYYLVNYVELFTVLASADSVIVQTEYQKRDMIELYGKCRNKIKVVPNDIPPGFRKECICVGQSKREALSNKQDVVLSLSYFGRVDFEMKGVDTLLHAVGHISKFLNVRLDIYGDGPDVARAKKIAEEICVSGSVVWHGLIYDVQEKMKHTDLVCIPSNFDHCPNVILEAIGCNRIVIATDIEAHRAILGKDYKGFSTKNVESLASNIFDVLMNEERRSHCEEQILLRKRELSFDWEARVLSCIFNSS